MFVSEGASRAYLEVLFQLRCFLLCSDTYDGDYLPGLVLGCVWCAARIVFDQACINIIGHADNSLNLAFASRLWTVRRAKSDALVSPRS